MSTSQELPEVSTWLNDTPRTTRLRQRHAERAGLADDADRLPPRRRDRRDVHEGHALSSGAFTTPMQFGPTMRTPLSRAIAASRCCWAMRSSLPVSA